MAVRRVQVSQDMTEDRKVIYRAINYRGGQFPNAARIGRNSPSVSVLRLHIKLSCQLVFTKKSNLLTGAF
jgi:hypothetical protein